MRNGTATKVSEGSFRIDLDAMNRKTGKIQRKKRMEWFWRAMVTVNSGVLESHGVKALVLFGIIAINSALSIIVSGVVGVAGFLVLIIIIPFIPVVVRMIGNFFQYANKQAEYSVCANSLVNDNNGERVMKKIKRQSAKSGPGMAWVLPLGAVVFLLSGVFLFMVGWGAYRFTLLCMDCWQLAAVAVFIICPAIIGFGYDRFSGKIRSMISAVR